VSSFLTAHQHIKGYFVEEEWMESTLREGNIAFYSGYINVKTKQIFNLDAPKSGDFTCKFIFTPVIFFIFR